jgi:hypothetical protein
MSKEAIVICTAIISMIATVAVVPEVRQWSCVHLGWLCDDELGRQRQADENKRREIEQRRLAEENRKRELERQKAEISSPPVITSIEGTIGTVGSNLALKINYKDRECDVVGGHWDGPAVNERISGTFGPSGSCSGGVGIIYFQRSCH